VNGQDARGWHSEMFKRLYWSGSKARFVGVSWFGDPGADTIGNKVQGYHFAVRNGVPTAAALAARVNALPGGAASKTVMGHSQGCWVSTLAVADYGMGIGNLFLLNAAFARECFDGESAMDVANMVPSEWQSYPVKTWAANWHKLFAEPPDDARAKLTWKDRLVNALTQTTVHSFYSSTEDVLEAYDGTPTQAVLDNTFYAIPHLDFSRFGRYAWVLQEKTKGDKTLLQGSAYGGWGFNLKDPFSPTDPVYWEWGLLGRKVKSPDELGELSDELLRRHPLFEPGWGIEGSILRINPPYPGTVSGAPEPMHELYGATGSLFASTHRAQLLAEMIPAISLPVGANATAVLLNRNYDMPLSFIENGRWARGEKEFTEKAEWKHSDVKNVAYVYVKNLFRKLTEISNQ
jgi:pimeloyl-ACP methyl ester carboxylesterase